MLAAGDERAFAAHALHMLRSKKRLDREAALAALAERPLPSMRDAVRELYFELDADGPKLDQAARMRSAIVRFLLKLRDTRDAGIAVRASDTSESLMGGDVTYELRTNGLRLLAHTAPDLLPYFAVEHLDDRNEFVDEPANTALQLLAATGHHASVYQWLISGEHAPTIIAAAFELLAGAPPAAIERYIGRGVETALRRSDEAFMTSLAEAIVSREIEGAYDALARMMSARISDELYYYLAVLLAGTNRPALLAILDEQLHRGRRPRFVVEALRIRPAPETEAIIKRWEDGDD